MSFISTPSASISIQEEAAKYIAGGVVSLNRKVTPHITFKRGKGCRIYDLEGNEYIDYHAAFAPHLLGHNDDYVNDAVRRALDEEWSLFGSGTTEWEARLSKMLCSIIPSLELVQITNTGSEATAHAIRLSRAYTGRDDIVLMLGGYNGWHNDVARTVMPTLEQLHAHTAAGEYPFIASSAGIPEGVKQRVHIVNFNDLESLEHILKQYPIACVLTEPVLQNIGVVLPRPGYLQGVLDLCEHYGAVCVFDEVKTGFCAALGGYQSVAGVTPHLTVLGKAVANGYPLGVIGGRRDIMELFDSPLSHKRVLIAGTYNAHPMNTAAAIATLERLQDTATYAHIGKMCSRLYGGMAKLFSEKSITASIASNASAFCVYFMDHAPVDLPDMLRHHDFAFDLRLRQLLIGKGIYHIPIACKQGSVSWAHQEDDIDLTLEKMRDVLQEI